ncbi:MAG: ribonuclease HI [Oligoflexia bacterium]|nr:ribonuclease HI [Oligoflexia bacterium]
MGIKKIEQILELTAKLKELLSTTTTTTTTVITADKLSPIYNLVDQIEQQLNELNITTNTKNTCASMKEKGDVFHLPLPQDFLNEEGKLALFADGASRGNPGMGAYAVFAQLPNETIVFDKCDFATMVTNNQMELRAVIAGLQEITTSFPLQLKEKIFVYTDSRYVVDGVNSWLAGWKKRNWRKADNKTPENLRLWQELDQLLANFKSIKFVWIKGHNNHCQNERCDKICNKILDKILKVK